MLFLSTMSLLWILHKTGCILVKKLFSLFANLYRRLLLDLKTSSEQHNKTYLENYVFYGYIQGIFIGAVLPFGLVFTFYCFIIVLESCTFLGCK